MRWPKNPRVETRGELVDVGVGMAHLMVGLLVEVEVVVGKVLWKNFPASTRCYNKGGRFRSFM